MPGAEIWEATAAEQASFIRDGTVSSRELVQAVLERIAEVNPQVNAYCTVDTDLAAAERADAIVRSGQPLGLLHGVPVSVKDLLETRDMRTTFGSMMYRNYVPDQDEVSVARLRNAGAVIIGKTNTSEFGYAGETDNRIFGRTLNPWDLARSPGGSSGGAAAAVAAGMGSLALGTDGGGSLRRPSSWCGVYGIKPTFGLVPSYPGGRDPRRPGPSGWESVQCVGPIARSVSDAALALLAIGGYDARDRHSAPVDTGHLWPIQIEGSPRLRVGWTTTLGYARIDHEVRIVLERIVARLENDLGWIVEELTPKLTSPASAFLATIAGETDLGALRASLETSRDETDPILAELLDRRWTDEEFTNAHLARKKLSLDVCDLMTPFDLLITPTTATAALPSGITLPDSIGGAPTSSRFEVIPFTYPFNLTGQPAATVPAGFTPGGLPVGLQFVGRRWDDAVVLAASAAFESVYPFANVRPLLSGTLSGGAGSEERSAT